MKISLPEIIISVLIIKEAQQARVYTTTDVMEDGEDDGLETDIPHLSNEEKKD